ncbi:hypothetical protein C8R45DRAFT_1171182 [Mycena sanguinolenta]|nr:hypothetical protein C8R45DRAFT_1171182 [Mycena sanguinolenta]
MSSAHPSRTHGLSPSIVSLLPGEFPPELLTEICQLCRSSEPDFSRFTDRALCGMAHLAQESLLRMAQVCSRWHKTVMGTPSLWNTVSLHEATLSGTPQQCETALGLLKVVLERSGSMPLTVESYPFVGHTTRFGPALKLIASHSARWKSAKILHLPSELRHLSSIQNNLLLLTTLELHVRGAGLGQLPLLTFVPNLKDLTVHGSIEFCMPILPLHGLVTYNCLGLQPDALRWAVASMSNLSYPCIVHIGTDIGAWDLYGPDLQIPQTSSNIGSFSLDVQGFFRPAPGLLAEIFAALTRPLLRDISFTAPAETLSWPHSRFIAFSARSSFQTHLHSLNLLGVAITEPELTDCLSNLPALRRLSIADRPPKPPLISNNLLTTLTRPAADSVATDLVPHLRVFECITAFRFDHSVYLGFLVSRCASGGTSKSAPFVSRMRSSLGYKPRAMETKVAAQIQNMCAQQVLDFQWPSISKPEASGLVEDENRRLT